MSEGAVLEGTLSGVRMRERSITDAAELLAASGVVGAPAARASGVRRALAERAEADRRERARKIAAGELHVVRSATFGRGRKVTCEGCDLVFTGRSDEAMARSFDRHAWDAAMDRRRARKAQAS